MGGLPQDGKAASDSIFLGKHPMAKADIGPALTFTLKNEGGYSDVPQDRGGATNFGITISDFSTFLGRAATKAEVKNMKLEQAKEIYRKKYWDAMNCGDIQDQSIATAIFDMGVLCGIRTSPKWAQEICGLDVDGRLGSKTLEALNNITRESFIPKFANRAQSYFQAIVDNRPNQKVFLKGWTNRANRLRALSKDDNVAVTPFAPKITPIRSGYYESIADLAKSLSVSHLADLLIAGMKKHGDGREPRYVSIFDVSKNSNAKRLHVLDVIAKSTRSIACSIGSGSDPSRTGMLQKFSNVSGSNCTSEGVFRYAETYRGKHGLSVRMDGQDETNSRMRSRAVVTHTASYVTESSAGRSNGCQAISESNKDLIPKLADGSFGIIGKEA